MLLKVELIKFRREWNNKIANIHIAIEDKQQEISRITRQHDSLLNSKKEYNLK